MAKYRIYQADAFTSHLFGGNPAAIVPLEEWIPDEQMQKIAAENNLAETAFLVGRDDHFELRWFTPELEIDLCGHATLASAHILYSEMGYAHDAITFRTQKAGDLVVTRNGDRYEMDFPARITEAVAAPEGLVEALGGPAPVEIRKSRDYFLVYENEDTIASMKPDFARLAQIDAIGIIVTAPGDSVDFVSRFFAPKAGINEDPVTGSAHCNLIPYWAGKLGKKELEAWQISARKGELLCEDLGERVLMSGKAVTYLSGEITI
ncbi:MAG: PhzF family phenazine biosynthesis protein [Mucilaginibacter polytrichastri]|nr:PhzF family phenazine biosynthesis protein [Mucilaginibacter polytrichastri]